MKLAPIAKSVILEYESEEIAADLEKEMGAALAKLTASAKTIKPEDKIEVPELTEVLDPVTLIGLVLAAPKMVEMLAKAFNTVSKKLNKYFKKGPQPQDDETGIAKNIIEFTHKWHSAYIKVLQFALEMFGVFAKAKITNTEDKKKATEMLYYTIIAALAFYSGVSSAVAFKKALMAQDIAAASSNFSLASLETAMTKVKSGEVKEFMQKIMV